MDYVKLKGIDLVSEFVWSGKFIFVIKLFEWMNFEIMCEIVKVVVDLFGYGKVL